MDRIIIRRAEKKDIPALGRLLFQVHKVHSDVRPDLFKAGEKKYTEEDLAEILSDEKRPVFAAERDGIVEGYAFCIHQQSEGAGRTGIRTLYIDDLCVDQAARGEKIGTRLYEFVLDYARKNGYYNVTLNVWADNGAAVRFYEKAGMRVQKIGMEQIL